MLSYKKSKTLLYLWVIIYNFLWIYITYKLDPTLPYDAIEAVNWGKNYEWGSSKNPWFVGMLMWLAIYFKISYSFYWYLIHFIGIAIGMIGVWYLAFLLSKNIQLSWLALLMLNLSGIINIDIIPYNDNYILVAIWPWIIFFFLKSIYYNTKLWIVVALLSGLATMAKYSTLTLIFSIFLLSIFIPTVRKNYKKPYFYISIIILVILITPNIIWLINNNFASIKWFNSQIIYQFNINIITVILLVFYPIIIITLILYKFNIQISWPIKECNQLANFILLFPLSVILLFFLFFHGKRITEWLQPFMIIAAPLLIGSIVKKPKISIYPILYFLIIIGIFVCLSYIITLKYNLYGNGQKMIGIKNFIKNSENLWKKKYNLPLKYVGGEDELYQWFIIYAKDRPNIIQPLRFDKKNNIVNIYHRKIKIKDLKIHGALLIGKKHNNCTQETFNNIHNYWPELKFYKESINYQEQPSSKVQSICIGFIPPIINKNINN